MPFNPVKAPVDKADFAWIPSVKVMRQSALILSTCCVYARLEVGAMFWSLSYKNP